VSVCVPWSLTNHHGWIGLQCEWAKSKARVERWTEEVQLVTEEMRRVVSFLEWKADWWTKQGNAHTEVRPDVADGILAYSAKQAYINHALAASFKDRWRSEGEKSKEKRVGLGELGENESGGSEDEEDEDKAVVSDEELEDEIF
jgi:hypothetical protein